MLERRLRLRKQFYMSLYVPVSIGELWDKYSILLIKLQYINDIDKITHINNELTLLDNYMKHYPYINHKLFILLEILAPPKPS